MQRQYVHLLTRAWISTGNAWLYRWREPRWHCWSESDISINRGSPSFPLLPSPYGWQVQGYHHGRLFFDYCEFAYLIDITWNITIDGKSHLPRCTCQGASDWCSLTVLRWRWHIIIYTLWRDHCRTHELKRWCRELRWAFKLVEKLKPRAHAWLSAALRGQIAWVSVCFIRDTATEHAQSYLSEFLVQIDCLKAKSRIGNCRIISAAQAGTQSEYEHTSNILTVLHDEFA